MPTQPNEESVRAFNDILLRLIKLKPGVRRVLQEELNHENHQDYIKTILQIIFTEQYRLSLSSMFISHRLKKLDAIYADLMTAIVASKSKHLPKIAFDAHEAHFKRIAAAGFRHSPILLKHAQKMDQHQWSASFGMDLKASTWKDVLLDQLKGTIVKELNYYLAQSFHHAKDRRDQTAALIDKIQNANSIEDVAKKIREARVLAITTDAKAPRFARFFPRNILGSRYLKLLNKANHYLNAYQYNSNDIEEARNQYRNLLTPLKQLNDQFIKDIGTETSAGVQYTEQDDAFNEFRMALIALHDLVSKRVVDDATKAFMIKDFYSKYLSNPSNHNINETLKRNLSKVKKACELICPDLLSTAKPKRGRRP